MAWKTRLEVAQAGNVMTLGTMGYGGVRKPVTDVGTRAALRLDRSRMVEDLVVKLRRTWRRDR